MLRIITLAAATSVLALGACNRDAGTTPAADETSAAASAATDATSNTSASVSSSAVGGASNASGSTTGSETLNPGADSRASPTGATTSGVSDQTRRDAKAEAEATNLHPKPPGT